MMQTQIPSGLQALMQASQVLSSQASPTAPGPQGPQPTVAERVNQQIKQVAQTQQPEGIAGLMPNMQDIGRQAGVAGQIMAQRQAQQEQTARNPEAIAQMAAQMMQSKGVAGLPANIGFKQGGIIGFDGEERSDVPEVDVPGMEALREILAGSEGIQVAGDNRVAMQALEDARQKLVAATQSDDPRAAQFYAQKVADLQKQVSASQVPAQASPVTPELRQQYAREATEMGFGKRMAFSPEVKQVVDAINSERQAEYLQKERARMLRVPSTRQPEPVDFAPSAAPTTAKSASPTISPEVADAALMAASSSAAKAAVPTAKPADKGIVQALPSRAAAPTAPAARPKSEGILSTLPATTIDKTGLEVPSAATVKAGAEAMTDRRAEQFNRELADIEKKRAELKASMPDLNQKEIEALEESKKARQQIAASKAERDQFNRVRAFFRDLYTRGDSYGTVQEGIFARDQAERLADENHSKAVILLQKAQQAEKLGDADRAAALKKEAYGRLTEEDKHLGEMAKIVQALQSSRYTAEAGMAGRQAEITSAERRTRAEIEQRIDEARQRHAELMVRTKELGYTREGQMLTAAFGKLDTATKNRDKIYDDTKNAMAMKDSKDPAGQQMYQDAINRRQVADRTFQQAESAYDSISSKILKETSGTSPSKTMTMADVKTTAQASGRSEADVIARAKAAGYTIK